MMIENIIAQIHVYRLCASMIASNSTFNLNYWDEDSKNVGKFNPLSTVDWYNLLYIMLYGFTAYEAVISSFQHVMKF